MPAEFSRNLKAIVMDISEGFVTLNPIFLKPFNENSLKQLHEVIERKQIELRSEPFPYNNADAIRARNLRLQRLYTALIILKNYAREKKMNIEAKEVKIKKKIAYF